MPYIAAAEWELISFFEVEPVRSEPDATMPWVYCDNLFVVKKEPLQLSFAIHPSYRDVRIILRLQEQIIYEFNGMNLEDVRYKRDKIGEVLHIELSEKEAFTLRIKPEISISHKASFVP